MFLPTKFGARKIFNLLNNKTSERGGGGGGDNLNQEKSQGIIFTKVGTILLDVKF